MALLRSSCTEQDLIAVETNLCLLIDNAADASKNAPPDAQALSSAKRIVGAAKGVLETKTELAEIERVNVLVGFVRALEQEVRNEIRRQSQSAIDGISADIQRMWKTLHPDAEIEHVKLYLAEGADKAIDIRL